MIKFGEVQRWFVELKNKPISTTILFLSALIVIFILSFVNNLGGRAYQILVDNNSDGKKNCHEKYVGSELLRCLQESAE